MLSSRSLPRRISTRSINDHRSCAAHFRKNFRIASTSPNNASHATERELLQKIASLSSNPIYPSSTDSEVPLRREIDTLVNELETTSSTHPLSLESRNKLVGTWSLVYANSGTVVTKSLIGTVIQSLDALPYVGLERVEQQLDDVQGVLNTTNAAIFGFGPFGTWEIVIYGTWNIEDTSKSVAKVSFDRYSMQMVGFFGVKLPAPKIELPTPQSRLADFATTYLSDDVRVSRGSSNNIFVFTKV